MVLRIEEGNLSADELGELAVTSSRPQVTHLAAEFTEGVGAVDTYLVGVGAVVTRVAAKVAFGKYAVGGLATG